MTSLSRVHAALSVLSAASYVVILGRFDVPWVWRALWSLLLLLPGVWQRRAELGLCAYAAILYGMPRYSSLFESAHRSGLLHTACALAVLGALTQPGRVAALRRSMPPIVWLALICFGWGLLSAWVSPDLPEIRGGERHHPIYFVHGLALLLTATVVMMTDAASTFLLTLTLAIGFRAWWQGADGLRLESDIGPLIAMLLPLALATAQIDKRWWYRIVMGIAIGAGLSVMALTYNRATAVAFVALSLVTLWQNRRRRWLVGGVALIGAVGLLWLAYSPYQQRFEAALAEYRGLAEGSVNERFELWRAGIAVARDHPVFGVGPGQYPAALETYSPALAGMPAHNNAIQIAAELGLPGLALIAALFALTLYAAQRSKMLGVEATIVAGALQAALVAYLVAGLFISRHDMVLAYVLIGWVGALTTAAVTTPPAPDSRQCREQS